MLKESLRLSNFDYHLPKELIAQYPCAKRGNCRLLLLDRREKKATHKRFADIVDYFSPGDCLVLNNTKVISARAIGRREKFNPKMGGGRQEIFLLENLSKDTSRVLARPAKKLTLGMKVIFEQAGACVKVIADEGMTKIIRFNGNKDAHNFWLKAGLIPLPPYIRREPEDLDRKRYQTVYAAKEGATASPTAGLHFTKRLLKAIRAKGVNIATLTLHINYGTFAPVKREDVRKHKMHKEYFILPAKTAKIVNQTRAEGKKVFSVGTTSVRVLEACANGAGSSLPLLKPAQGRTDLFIYPPYSFKIVDCLLTNFHFPKSTLLMLVSAFAGRKLLFKAYQEAIDRRYRFFSYGDAMLIL